MPAINERKAVTITIATMVGVMVLGVGGERAREIAPRTLRESTRLGMLLQSESLSGPGAFAKMGAGRRGGRAADCTGLENRRRRKPFASSNLAPSAFMNHVIAI